jgi:hypothetical protein
VLDCLDDPHTPSPVCLMAGALTTEVLAEPDLRKYVVREANRPIPWRVGALVINVGLAAQTADSESYAGGAITSVARRDAGARNARLSPGRKAGAITEQAIAAPTPTQT